MAGGKLTPRQKMVNLMYLVFIAMLALNVSKEVISGFGLMNEKFEDSNSSSLQSNEQMLMALDAKAAEAKGEFEVASKKAHQLQTVTKRFYDYIGTIKTEVLNATPVDAETGKRTYEEMDKSEVLDNLFFSPNGYSAKGNEVIATIENYKKEVKNVLGNDKKFQSIISELDKKMDLSDVLKKMELQLNI